MPQSLKQLKRDDSPYRHMMSVIDVGKAAYVLMRALKGESVTPQQERVALAVYNKMVPNLQAVSLQIESVTPQSKADIDGMLMLAGLEPDTHWDTIEGEAVQLKDVPE